MKFFEINGPFFKIGTELADLMILTLYWLIGCLPIITIGNSTAALFYVYGKKMRNEDVYITKDFIKSYKNNFKQSIPITILLLVLWTSAFLYTIMRPMGFDVWGIMFAGLSIFFVFEVSIVSIYVFALLSRYYMSIKSTFVTAFLLANKHILTSIMLLIIFATVVFFALLMPIIFIMSPALAVAMQTFFILRVFNKNMPNVQEDEPEVEIYEELEQKEVAPTEDKDFLKYI
ncbi:MAG: hypothetical protein ATN35_10255 [Epulopiscium sp. Nele67-Bin004]|nr:MAG: hypothetical protein ATN35_10255 [Epulopiscium sp. Nele67-Bin004]